MVISYHQLYCFLYKENICNGEIYSWAQSRTHPRSADTGSDAYGNERGRAGNVYERGNADGYSHSCNISKDSERLNFLLCKWH